MAIRKVAILNGLLVVDHVNPRKRKEVKLSHGFRKFFETMLVNANLNEVIIKKLTGHSPSGDLTQLYSKQTEEEMLQEYEKAIDFLTINPENRLKRELIQEKQKNTETSKILARLAKLEQEAGIKI